MLVFPIYLPSTSDLLLISILINVDYSGQNLRKRRSSFAIHILLFRNDQRVTNDDLCVYMYICCR